MQFMRIFVYSNLLTPSISYHGNKSANNDVKDTSEIILTYILDAQNSASFTYAV